MDLKKMNYVLAIAECRNITKAANMLYISQPTLTKFLQNLESHLGVKLFVREGHTWYPTYAGERYLVKAQQLVNLNRELEDEMNDIVHADRSRIRIGLNRVRATYMLPLTLPAFARVHPNTEVSVVEQDSTYLEELLSQGTLDLAFFNGPVVSPGLDSMLISEEELVLVLPKGHPLSAGAVSRPGCAHAWLDLKKCADIRFMIQYPGQKTRLAADALFQSLDFTPSQIFETGSLYTSVALAAEGYGAALISDHQLHYIHPNDDLDIFSVGQPSTAINFIVAYRRGGYLSRHAQAYIELVKEKCQAP